MRELVDQHVSVNYSSFSEIKGFLLKLKRLRTFTLRIDKWVTFELTESLASHFRYLRVLDLKNVRFEVPIKFNREVGAFEVCLPGKELRNESPF